MTRSRRTQARRVKDSRREVITSARRLFGRLGDEEMLYVLVHLAEGHPEIVAKVKQFQKEFAGLVHERMKGVDTDEVAADVLSDLNTLDAETLWDISGSDRHGGYYDPSDASWDMFSDEMDSFAGYLEDLWKEGLREDAAAYCLGLLKGLARFHVEGKAQAREWFGEESYTYARDLLEKWNKMSKGGPWLRWVLDRVPQTLPARFLVHFHPERELGIHQEEGVAPTRAKK